MIEAGRAAPEGALVGVDVGGTFTDAAVVQRGPPGDRQGAHDARTTRARASSRRCWRRWSARAWRPATWRGFAPRDDRRHQRPARGQGRPHRRWWPPRGSATCWSCAARTGPTSTASTPTTRPRSCPTSAPTRCASGAAPEGVVTPLDAASVERVVDAVRADGAEAVAVGLLFSFAHPEHEAAVARGAAGRAARRARERLPARCSPRSASTSGSRPRRSTRTSRPVLRRYLRRLGERAGGRPGCPPPRSCSRAAGCCPSTVAAEHAAWTVLSGPAGGVIGAARLAGARATARWR